MIAKWRVENFKSIYEKTNIELAPLTIFAGANSSGKSTIIQSMLLTAQTIQSPVHSKSVVLNGHILRMGAYNDIASNFSDGNSVQIGFNLRRHSSNEGFSPSVQMQASSYGYYSSELAERVREIDVSFEFSAKSGNADEVELLQLQPILNESRIKLTLADQDEKNDELHVVRSATPVDLRAASFKLPEQRSQSAEADSLRYEVKKPTSLRSLRRYSAYGLPSKGTPAGAVFNHFLPAHLTIVYDAVEEEANVIFEALANPREVARAYGREAITKWEQGIEIRFRTQLYEILTNSLSKIDFEKVHLTYSARTSRDEFQKNPTLTVYFEFLQHLPLAQRRIVNEKIVEQQSEIMNALKAERKPRHVLAFAPLTSYLEFATDYVRSYFTSNLKYLGPLRDEPKSIYPLSGTTDSRDVGFRGEHTAAVLETHKNTGVTYVPSRAYQSPNAAKEPTNTTLISAVSDWLNYMGVVQNLQTTDKGKLGHELKVCTSEAGELHELTHVGVGVSQVLPILVLSLLADPDSTLIFEQPELHLHPKVQTRLAEFFVAMSMLGKQCIVETHSEYLINRLRYLSAVGAGKTISDQVILYFVEKEKGHSRYQPIRINEFGVIPDWPTGFFDENEDNAAAILKAGMEKRRAIRLSSNVPPAS